MRPQFHELSEPAIAFITILTFSLNLWCRESPSIIGKIHEMPQLRLQSFIFVCLLFKVSHNTNAQPILKREIWRKYIRAAHTLGQSQDPSCAQPNNTKTTQLLSANLHRYLYTCIRYTLRFSSLVTVWNRTLNTVLFVASEKLFFPSFRHTDHHSRNAIEKLVSPSLLIKANEKVL